MSEIQPSIKLVALAEKFSVCKVIDYSQIDIERPFVFTGATDAEKSLVCPTRFVPANAVERNDGWRAFRIEGTLDFSLVGILSRISKCLADNNIGIFAISTYNTDYIFTRSADFEHALMVLKTAEYEIQTLVSPNGTSRG